MLVGAKIGKKSDIVIEENFVKTNYDDIIKKQYINVHKLTCEILPILLMTKITVLSKW